MSVHVQYQTTGRAHGGRDGRVQLLDGSLELKMSTPKEIGGAGGEGHNPEQLFALGYAACFLNAVKFIALKEQIRISPESTVTAQVGIGPNDSGGFELDIALEVSLPGIDVEKARDLTNKAHQACPYSNATRGNVDVRLSVA